MNKPKTGIAKRPRDLELVINQLVDEINALKAQLAGQADAGAAKPVGGAVDPVETGAGTQTETKELDQ